MKWSPSSRSLWIIRLIGIGLIGGMLLSWKLWISDRLYPLFPVWDFVIPFPAPLDTIILGVFLILAAWLVVRPNHKAIIAVLVFVVVLALQDQSRWQPWFYQYGLMLLPFAFVARWNEGQSQAVLGILQLVIVMVYIWGGIHKCQPGWMSVWEYSLMAPILARLPYEGFQSAVVACGYLIPLIEIAMAIGLLFRPTRLVAILLALSTHLVILFLLGPVKGYISNSVVWPWNLVMVGMVIVLFFRVEGISLNALSNPYLRLPAWVIAVLMTVAPVLFYFGLWDRYLSFSLYAGQQKRYLVQVEASAAAALPPEYDDFVADPQAPDGHYILSPGNWSLRELNVPLISEWRILRAFSRKICQDDKFGSDPYFYVDHRHFPKKPKYFFRCSEIEEMGR